MNKIETKIIILGFVVLFTFFYLKPFYNSQVNGLLESDLQPTPFSLNSNDSSEIKIFFLSYQIGIGTTWNVTFIVDSSSTSSISGYFSYLYSTSIQNTGKAKNNSLSLLVVSLPNFIFPTMKVIIYSGQKF